MDANTRREKIIEILRERKEIKIIELSAMLDASRETIRSDIQVIEDEDGPIRKIYGGVLLDESTQETAYAKRKETNSPAKASIAKEALSLIGDGDTVYLDYGTTVLALAKEIANSDLKNLKVVTNALPVMSLLSSNPEISMFVPGGVIRRNEFSFVGKTALDAIERIFVDIGFFGCAGVNRKSGITNIIDAEVDFSRVVLEHSTNRVILADDSKFGITSYRQVASFDEVDMVITDPVTNTKLLTDIRREHRGLKIVEVKL
ncbi:DeoR/GlpR family DNA-binding transcription regulator [Dolosicoccus paucivorans]